MLLKPKKAGGVSISTTVPLTKLDEKTIRTIVSGLTETKLFNLTLCCLAQLAGNKLHNMDVYIREDITVDEFIDVLIGNRRYVNCIYVYNKIDTISMEEVDRIARTPNSVVISCELELNLDGLRKAIWEVRNKRSLCLEEAGWFLILTNMTVETSSSNWAYCEFSPNHEGKE